MKLPLVGLVVGFALVAGCKKKENAAPVPEVGSGSASGSGSAVVGSGSSAGSAMGADPGSGSAGSGSGGPGSATGSLVISAKGVGPIVELKPPAGADQESEQKRLSTLLEPLGLTVSGEVMDMPGEVEREEGYLSAKKGDKEVLQIFDGNEVNPEIVIHVVDPMFTTADGIKVGDPLSVLADKRKDLACTADGDEELGFLTCKSPAEPQVVFVLVATDYKGKDGKPVDLKKNADRAILEIVR